MTAPELLCLSLGVSVLISGLCLTAGSALERRVRDPRLRGRAWTASLYATAAPPVIVALLLLAPAPRVAAAASSSVVQIQVAPEASGKAVLQTDAVAILGLGLSGLIAGYRIAVLVRRSLRLSRIVRTATPATPEVLRAVNALARRIGIDAPVARISDASPDAMVVGFRAPLLILPRSLATNPRDPVAMAICAHELAHLRRGDHRAQWIEELLLALFAANPLLAALRQRGAAAREEACDTLALAGADPALRRHYAQALIDSLRTGANPLPALTFSSTKRNLAMLRLKAVLAPATPSGPGGRLAVLGLGVAAAAIALSASIALAAQREPVPVARPAGADKPVAATHATAPTPLPTPTPVIRTPGRLILAEAEPVARAVETPAKPPAAVITNPSWAERPLPNYPNEAAKNGVSEGSAVVSCLAQADGHLNDCTVVSEDPVGNGFGPAAAAAAGAARLDPGMAGGVAPGANIRFTVRFRLS